MLLPYVVLRLPDGGTRLCYAGTLIGRSPTCGLCLLDARVSEAHALVSARDDGVYLLALRRPFWVAQAVERTLRLTEGATFELVRGVTMRVESVGHGEQLGLRLGEGPLVPVRWREASVVPSPDWLRPPGEPGAIATLFCAGGRVWLVPRGGEPRPLELGARWQLEGQELVCEALPPQAGWTRNAASLPATRVHAADPARVVVVDEHGRQASLRGKPAELLFAMAGADGTLSREQAVTALWGRRGDETSNLETNVLNRLRVGLQRHGLRSDVSLVDGVVSFGQGVTFERTALTEGDAW